MHAMKLLTVLTGLVCVIAVARCGQSGAANGGEYAAALALPDTLDLAYQDTLFIGGGDWLTFDSLMTDSRCPTGTTCVWEGNATIGVSLYQGDVRHALTLNTHPTFATDTTLAALTVALLDLRPYPHVDSTYGAAHYTARLFVSR